MIERIRARYERWAGRYDRAYGPYGRRTAGPLVRAISRTQATEVLEIACGTGIVSERLLDGCPRIRLTCLDLSQAMLDVAGRRLRGFGGRVQLVRGAIEQASLPVASYDAIACANAFHLFQDGARVIERCAGLLRPGGTLVVVDWCRESPAMRMLAFLQRWGRLRRRMRSRAELANLFERSGLVVESRERFGVPPAWGMMLVSGRRPST